MSYRLLAVKILPSMYVGDFLDGNLYLNTLSFFRNVDASDAARHDAHEGIHATQQFREIAVQDPHSGEWLPLKDSISPITVRLKRLDELNALCLYMVTDRPGDYFHPYNLQFGDTAVAITDLKGFLRRIRRAAAVVGRAVEVAPIEYVDRTQHDGLMGPFRKFNELRYQNELRVLLSQGDGLPCRLSVGDLRDITLVGPTNGLPHLWEHMLKKA